MKKLPSKTELRVIRYIHEHPGAYGFEVARECGIPLASIYVHLRISREKGLIRRVSIPCPPKRTRYKVTSHGRDAIKWEIFTEMIRESVRARSEESQNQEQR